MNIEINNYPNKITAISYLIVVLYVGYVMFSLPYMTMDEVNWISKDRLDRLLSTIENGRPSQFIMALTTYIFQFEKPHFINMAPRFIAVILMLFALFKYVKSCGLSDRTASIYIVFFTLTHQLDWQHNGMLAFFSIFCVYIGAFLYAINDDNWSMGFNFFRMSLFLISFGNELFLIMSILILFYGLLLEKKKAVKYREMLIALFICVGLYAYHFLNKEVPSGMQNYLVGSFGKFSYVDMLYSGFLYYTYSVPFLSYFLRGDFSKLWAIAITVSISIIFMTIAWRKQRQYDLNGFYYLLILFILAVLPQFLMSAQPSKVEWILKDASHRYAFSLYSWIFLSFVIFRTVEFFHERNSYIIKSILVSGMLSFSFISVINNINFVHSFANSLNNWKVIVEYLTDSSESIELPRYLLKHPNILPVQDYHVQNYSFHNFGKIIKFLPEDFYAAKFEDGIDFRVEGLPSFIQSVNGLSNVESFGRWSDANLHPYVEIIFKDKLPKNFILKVIISAYDPNRNEVMKILIGDSISSVNFMEKNNEMSVYEFSFNKIDSNSIKFIMPKSTSPKDVNPKSDDGRRIGFRISSLHISPM
jgi:hypothetical protein